MTPFLRLPLRHAFQILVATGLLAISFTALPSAAEECTGLPKTPTTASSDETRIRDIIADQVVAWNAGDAKAFSASFSEDGSFTNIRGTVVYGRRAFLDRHAEIFQSVFKGSTLAMSPTKIRFVRPDVAIVDIATVVSGFAGVPRGVKRASDGRLHTRLQEVLVKNDGAWWIESFHNVDVKEQ